MLLRELSHDNIVHLVGAKHEPHSAIPATVFVLGHIFPALCTSQDSVHINRAEPSLWLAFDYADHDLFELVRFHRDHRDSRYTNPTGYK